MNLKCEGHRAKKLRDRPAPGRDDLFTPCDAAGGGAQDGDPLISESKALTSFYLGTLRWFAWPHWKSGALLSRCYQRCHVLSRGCHLLYTNADSLPMCSFSARQHPNSGTFSDHAQAGTDTGTSNITAAAVDVHPCEDNHVPLGCTSFLTCVFSQKWNGTTLVMYTSALCHRHEEQQVTQSLMGTCSNQPMTEERWPKALYCMYMYVVGCAMVTTGLSKNK